MGLYTASMLADVKLNGGCWLLELGLPGGTKRYSFDSVSSAALGLYDGRLQAMSEVRRSASDRNCGLAAMEVSADISDVDMALAKIVEGALGHQVPGSTAVIKLGPTTKNVAAANWLTMFTGVVDKVDFAKSRTCHVTMRTNDLLLQRSFPKTPLAVDFPRASRDVTGMYSVALYGKFDSIGAGGSVPLQLVDVTLCWYLVCQGKAKSVDRVYVDGVQAATGWSTSYPVVNGRVYTVVVFTTSQGAKAITADVQGYESVGDGSGALQENPAWQIGNLLANWIYGSYSSGAWLADSTAPVDTTYLAALTTYFTAHANKGSRRLAGAQRTGLSVLEEWCQSNQVRPFWTNLGKVGLRLQNPADVTAAVLWLRPEVHELDPITLPYDTAQVLSTVDIRYLRDETQGDYTQTLQLKDPSAQREGSFSLELPWSSAA